MRKGMKAIPVLAMSFVLAFGNVQVETAAAKGSADGEVVVGVNSDWTNISPYGTMSSTRSGVMYNFYEYLAVRKDFGAELKDMELECAKEISFERKK